MTLARRDVVQEYEALCAAQRRARGHRRPLDVQRDQRRARGRCAGAAGDWLLVNVASDYASIAILRGPDLIFFRSRGADSEGTLADLVHQTAMYYEDRLQGAGFARVMLSGAVGPAAADVEQIRPQPRSSGSATAVETVDPRAAATLTDRITAAPALLDTLAPLVGLLVRGREAAA